MPLSGKDPYAMTNKIQGEKCYEKYGDYHRHTHTQLYRVGGPNPNRCGLEFKAQVMVEVLLDLSFKG